MPYFTTVDCVLQQQKKEQSKYYSDLMEKRRTAAEKDQEKYLIYFISSVFFFHALHSYLYVFAYLLSTKVGHVGWCVKTLKIEVWLIVYLWWEAFTMVVQTFYMYFRLLTNLVVTLHPGTGINEKNVGAPGAVWLKSIT